MKASVHLSSHVHPGLPTHLCIQWLWPSLQDLHCHLEAEHELVALKQPQAGVAVHVAGQGVGDGTQPALKVNLTPAASERLCTRAAATAAASKL